MFAKQPSLGLSDFTIRPRNVRFPRNEDAQRWWHGGDPIATAFYNALSATFPLGETLFIESVRQFREGAEPKLAREIAGFIQQEATHTREHRALNRRIGYDISALEARVQQRLNVLRSKPPIVSLAATIAFEHFTAVMANALLSDPRHMAGAADDIATLWRWHAVEEIEHKGVCYDTWLHATRDWGRFKRWRTKSLVMLLVTRNYLVDRVTGVLALLRQDGITGPRAWARLAWFALIRPGMITALFRSYGRFFLPGFHPWHVDDRALVVLHDEAARGDIAAAE
jgi:predicted metal-dependent hydrolase